MNAAEAGGVTLAEGFGTGGERWTLTVAGDPTELRTMVHVTTLDGSRQGGGMGGPALYPDARINLFVGRSDTGPAQLVMRVADDVRAVVVRLSDWTREDLVLYGDPATLGARVAVLTHPRDLDVHRIDLLDATGAELSEQR